MSNKYSLYYCFRNDLLSEADLAGKTDTLKLDITNRMPCGPRRQSRLVSYNRVDVSDDFLSCCDIHKFGKICYFGNKHV